MNKTIFTICFILFFCFFSPSQTVNKTGKLAKDVLKIYQTRDSVNYNKQGILVLYTDNSFVNFGIVGCDLNIPDTVWYASGNWLYIENKLTFRSYIEIPNELSLQNEIETFYQFTHENFKSNSKFKRIKYLDHVFENKKDFIFDERRKFDYYELN